ncbi:MAG: AI-2E family transporter [Planctomycetota bacterium]|jgi:predicted PurR-regulated permease PerM
MKRLQRRRYQIALVVALVILVLVLMYTQRMVFNPFLLALVVAYILNPVVNWMERRRVPRKSAVVLLLSLLSVLTLAGAVTLIPMAANQAHGWYVAFFGEPFPLDLNRNGRYDEIAERDTWNDVNGNGVYDGPEFYTDRNGNGAWDDAYPGDPFVDADGDGEWDENETYTDTDGNGEYTPARPPEPFDDRNGDGKLTQVGEPFTDLNHNGRYDPDIPADGPWEDLNQDGKYDPGYLGRLTERLTDPDLADEEGTFLGMVNRYVPRDRWTPLVRSAMGGLRQNLKSVASGTRTVISTAFEKGWAAAGRIWNLLLLLVLTPIYLCFLLYGMRGGWEAFVAHVPATVRPRFLDIAHKTDIVIGAFFRGRLLVCTAIAIFTAVGFFFCGVKFGLLFGLMIGVTSFIPFLNSIPFALTLLVCWLDNMTLGGFAGVIVVFGLGQCLDPLLMTLVMGKELQLHPVTILLSMFVCASLLGFFGMLLAVPIVAVGKILFVEFVLPHLRELAEEPVG